MEAASDEAAAAGEGVEHGVDLNVDVAVPAFVPAPGVIPGASHLPPAPVPVLEAITEAVGGLRDEVLATEDKTRRARLLYEAGEIQERAGDEPGAAREYLAAYNADTSFREPLEGLVRLLERRRSLANLGKLIEALVAAATTPAERARALVQRAVFFEDVQQDLEGARGAAREATETGAAPADLGPAWLTLDLVAARLDDHALREEALVGRAELTTDPTWRGLLLTSAAELAAQIGEVERALSLLARARDDGGSAVFSATATVERILRADPGLPSTDEARARSRALAESREVRADMIREALANPSQGDAQGVPQHVRRFEHVVDLLLRAADARRAASEVGRAAQNLDRALEVLAETKRVAEEESDAGDENAALRLASAARIERVVLTSRLRFAELIGNTALAAELATKRMAEETDGGVIASLAMRIAEHAASEGDVTRALEALEKATEADPVCAPARALKIDILEASADHARFATELEELSRHCTTGDAQGRALLLAAYVWATRARDASRACEALGQAEACGVPKETIARLARSLASVRGDDAWYEVATRSLLEQRLAGVEKDDAGIYAADPSGELPMLLVELARLRLAQGDDAGAAKEASALRSHIDGRWLGRVLDGLASPDADPARARTALEELTADVADPVLRRSLTLVCVLRAHAAGDHAAAIAHLTKLAEDDAHDPLVAAYLADLLRATGDRAKANALASEVADAFLDDPTYSAARRLEAGFESWKLGDRSAARTAFAAAAEAAPDAGSPASAWALRGIDVDAPEGRRAALEAAGTDAGVALERFALEATTGNPDAAATALETAFGSSNPNLELAASLARLVWQAGPDAEERASAALASLAATSEAAKTAAAAERVRLLRESDGDYASAAETWLGLGGGATAAVEWLAGSIAAGAPETEVRARRAVAEILVDDPREAMHASATLLGTLLAANEARERGETYEPQAENVEGASHAVRLANLELAPPGTEPRRRASALAAVDVALGEEAELDALALGAWSELAAGNAGAALEAFRTVTATRADDLQAWEGLRAAAEELADHEAYGVASEQLGSRCASDARGAAFFEQAALAWLKLGSAFEQRAEAALDASFARDATRRVAFDRLFRRVRDRKDGEKLLAIIERRLGSTSDAEEIAKLFWEQARVLREKGDPDGALQALAHVTTYDENHVGALALTGEIYIRRGMFADAADNLARLACVQEAPPKNRVTAGIAAVDLYENKLGRFDMALQVLLVLHAAKLTTLPVRERLARAAARTGAWGEATRILEELMNERPEKEGRIEAARLAIVVYRDRMMTPQKAIVAATKLLEEAPSDGEALDLVVGLDPAVRERKPLLERGRDAIIMALHENPANVDNQRRLARVAHALNDGALEQSTLGCAVALGGPDGSSEQMIALLGAHKPRAPLVSFNETMIRQILAPGDDGAVADLFAALGPTLAEALGPTRDSLGVTRKDRVDPKAGIALRSEIAQWAHAFGIDSFDLYIGGKDPGGVQGIAGDTPAIVVGSGVNAPLSPTTRGRVARELLSIVRGTTVTRWRDDATLGAILVAVCEITKVKIDTPPGAGFAEVERVINKAISGRTKRAIEPLCRAYAASGQDVRQWAARARTSQGRVATLAAGDVSVVLAEVFGEPLEKLGAVIRDDIRAHELLRFALSRPYFDLRRTLGLEG